MDGSTTMYGKNKALYLESACWPSRVVCALLVHVFPPSVLRPWLVTWWNPTRSPLPRQSAAPQHCSPPFTQPAPPRARATILLSISPARARRSPAMTQRRAALHGLAGIQSRYDMEGSRSSHPHRDAGVGIRIHRPRRSAQTGGLFPQAPPRQPRAHETRRACSCPVRASQARGATVRHVRTVASVGCVATAQIARMYSFEMAAVQDDEYVITADADALICSKDILGPLDDGKTAVWNMHVRRTSPA